MRTNEGPMRIHYSQTMIAFLVVLLTATLTLAYQIWTSHNTIYDEEVILLKNRMLVAENFLNSSLQRVNNLLVGTNLELNDRSPLDSEKLIKVLKARRDILADIPGIEFSFWDSQGNFIANATGESRAKGKIANSSDRKYFKILTEQNPGTPFSRSHLSEELVTVG